MIPYTHCIRDENGVELIPDVEVELEVEVSLSGGSPEIEIKGVWAEGVDLLRSKHPVVLGIACQIAEDAERDDNVVEQALAEAGLVYRGLGGNDPDGHYVRRAFA